MNEWLSKDILKLMINKLIVIAATSLAAHGFELTNNQQQKIVEWVVSGLMLLYTMWYTKYHHTKTATTPTPANQATAYNPMAAPKQQ